VIFACVLCAIPANADIFDLLKELQALNQYKYSPKFKLYLNCIKKEEDYIAVTSSF